MQEDPWHNPWLAHFFPPKPATNVTPTVIAEYLKSLERQTTPPTPPRQFQNDPFFKK